MYNRAFYETVESNGLEMFSPNLPALRPWSPRENGKLTESVAVISDKWKQRMERRGERREADVSQ